MRKGAALSLLMAIVTLLAVAGGFASFQRKRSTFERLDFRYHWDRGQVVVETVEPGSHAEEAGIRPDDRMWVVGGVPATEIDGLKKTLRRIGPVDILIARGNDTVTVRYEAPELSVDYDYLFLSFIAFLVPRHRLVHVLQKSRDGVDDLLPADAVHVHRLPLFAGRASRRPLQVL